MKGRTLGQIVLEQMFAVTPLYLEMPLGRRGGGGFLKETLIGVLSEKPQHFFL